MSEDTPDPDQSPQPGVEPDARPAMDRFRLSVLFCDLCDSTTLSGSLEPEDYAWLLVALRKLAFDVVPRCGGTVVRLQGDGMLAVFGHPLPREGDGRRAVEAALQLHEGVKRIAAQARGNGVAGLPPEGLHLHSGIHAGMVLVQGGDVVTGRLELLGVVPNIAARLSAEAGRDELLVSDDTLGPARALFATGEKRLLHPLRLRGEEQPLLCWPVLGPADAAPARSPGPAPASAARTPFVGRAAELARLQVRLAEVLGDRATRQVALLGPPGVGKSRLASEFLQRATQKGCRVLTGLCDSELGALPLQPVLQMVRTALGLQAEAPVAAALNLIGVALQMQGLGDVVPALLPLLGGPASGAPSASPAAKDASAPAGSATPPDPVPAIARLFAAWAERQPLVLFIDDWHGCDAASRQAVAAICEQASGAGLMVLLSTRTAESGDAAMRHLEVVPVAPFSPEEGAASIRARLPLADPFVVDEIYRYSGGNPLYIEELCHSDDASRRAAYAALLAQARPAGQQGVAAWLQRLVAARVARLPAAQAQLLRTLAVVGNVVPATLLAALTGHAPDDPALAELAEKDFVYPGPDATLRFKHGLTRDVIHQSLTQPERQDLHLRVARALQAQARPGGEAPHEALAYHFDAAGRDAEAAHHAELAGDRAAALSALDRAKALYHRALTRLDAAGLDSGRVQRWLAIANKLGLICVFDASRKDLPVFEQAVRLAQAQADPALQARAEYWLGYVLYALGQAHDAVTHCERAAALAGPGEEPLAVQIRATLGQARAAAAEYAGAQALLEDAVAIKRRHRRGLRASVGLAYSLVCLASVRADIGEFARAHELMDEAWSLVDGTRHEIGASITGWRAVMFSWQGRWAEAVAAAEQSEHIAERTHSLFQFCQGRATGAYAAWMLSGAVHDLERLAESTLWLEPRESGLFRSLDHGWLAEGWVAHDDIDKARAHAARALVRGRAGDIIGVALGCRAMAREARQRQAWSEAERWLARARRVAEQRSSLHESAGNALCAAEIALAQGDRLNARRLGQQAAAAFERLHMAWHAERARGLLAQA